MRSNITFSSDSARYSPEQVGPFTQSSISRRGFYLACCDSGSVTALGRIGFHHRLSGKTTPLAGDAGDSVLSFVSERFILDLRCQDSPHAQQTMQIQASGTTPVLSRLILFLAKRQY